MEYAGHRTANDLGLSKAGRVDCYVETLLGVLSLVEGGSK